jgi:hypothetical protein
MGPENSKQKIVDGMVLNDGSPQLIVEIKYITSRSFPNLKYLIYKFNKSLQRLGLDAKLVFCVVSEEMTEEYAQLMYDNNKSAADLRFFYFQPATRELEEIKVK